MDPVQLNFGPSGLHALSRKCPLLTAIFLFLLSRRRGTFLPGVVIIGFQSFAWGFKSKKNKISGKTKFGGPPMPPGGIFFVCFPEGIKSA